MKTKSIWEDTLPEKKEKEIQSSLTTDILIIGAGMAGISTAFFLRDSDQKVMIIDKGKIGMGVTSKTTGKLTFLQGLAYQKLEKTYNKEISKLYFNSQKEAIELVKENVEKYHIACDLTKVPSYTFTENPNNIKSFIKEKDLLKEFGIHSDIIENLPLDYPAKCVLRVEDSYVFHPLKYLSALRDLLIEVGMVIHENTCASEIKEQENRLLVETNNGSISAHTVIVCTHYPFFIKPCFIPFKSHIEKSYILAVPSVHIKDASIISYKDPSISMRFYKDYFLYCGQSHKTSTHLNIKERYDELITDYKKHFGEQKDISYIWSTHDVITEDGMPYIGIANNKQKNIMIATGFNKWGMTGATIAGKILSDIVLKKENPYIKLFKPNRAYNLKRLKEFMINGIHTGKIFLQTKINKNPTFYKENISVIKKNGTYYGKYVDPSGNAHIVHNSCPHMGCSLIFNEYDLTWDCPCHGSRFDIDGDIIEGPSTYSIKPNKKNTLLK